MIRAMYPGSFDPVTKGHADIIGRALSLFDEVIIGVGENNKKRGWLTPLQRVELITRLCQDEFSSEFEAGRIIISTYSNLTVDFCKLHEARVLLRGLRTISDFDHEFSLALNNMELDDSIQTLFMVPRSEFQFISSSSVREIYLYDKKRTKKYLPPSVYVTLCKGDFTQ